MTGWNMYRVLDDRLNPTLVSVADLAGTKEHAERIINRRVQVMTFIGNWKDVPGEREHYSIQQVWLEVN